MKNIFSSLLFRLVFALAIGITIGLAAGPTTIQILATVQDLLSQLIMFCIPLIILGFVAPAIAKMGANASKLLGVSLIVAYLSSVGAALFSTVGGYGIIPNLDIANAEAESKAIPALVFQLSIPQIMPVMSALALAILLGLAAAWNKAAAFITLLDEFQKMVISVIKTVVIRLLPLFIGCTFSVLTYRGAIVNLLPVFLVVIILVIAGQIIWMALLYGIAAAYSKKNPFEIIRHYGPAYLTALGTMSSAATLSVALQCANKSKVLRKDLVSFGIPLFSNIHLCGSVLTLTFFVMVVSQILYGQLPEPSNMVLFCVLVGIFGIAAPGVPGGTVMASLGLITSVLGIDSTGTALILTIFALQDSFGTACNITGDGALTLILSSYAEKHNIGEQQMEITL